MKVQVVEFRDLDNVNDWLATKSASDVIAILPVPHHCINPEGLRTTQIIWCISYYDQEL